MQVAYKLMVMHEECLEGKFQSIERLRETIQQKAAVHHVRQVIISRNLALNHLCSLGRIIFLIRCHTSVFPLDSS